MPVYNRHIRTLYTQCNELTSNIGIMLGFVCNASLQSIENSIFGRTYGTLFGRRAYFHVHAYVLDRYPDLGHLVEACLEPTEITTLQN